MSSSRQTVIVVMAAILILALGGGVLVVPSARELISTRGELQRLRARAAQLHSRIDDVALLATDLNDRRAYAAQSLKRIPPAPDVADLIGRLSLPVDGLGVMDQTFTAGSAAPALPDEEAMTKVMPLTIDLEGSFDSVLGVLRLAEGMDRLVRVSSVRMSTSESDHASSTPVVTASLGLEIVYQPPATEEK